jgi:CheY-like chemotaxis protein/HPt (histidine-containing phosphotransfer) domain-containing protein
MHGMIGMTELLLHTNLNDQQRKFAEAAHNSGESLLNLINEILDFSKIEASKVELETVEFGLTDLIDDICYLQAEPALRKGLSLVNVCDSDWSSNIIGDPTKIRQVIMNLVSNSIKFTHQGSVSVITNFSRINDAQNTANVEIKVSDTGIGMDELTQKKVFEAFTQADTSTTREYGGTGLGLAISRHYVELMNGSIDLFSEPNRGTTIAITLPMDIGESGDSPSKPLSGLSATVFCLQETNSKMATSHLESLGVACSVASDLESFIDSVSPDSLSVVDQEIVSENLKLQSILKALDCLKGIVITPLNLTNHDQLPKDWQTLSRPITNKALVELLSDLEVSTTLNKEEPSARSSSLDQPLKVLVAEDVATNQKIAMEMLQILDCDVSIANNGEEAIELFANYREFDLIFMDCQMPILDGFEATKMIRDLELQSNETPVPIVALTAGISKEDEQRCYEVGMNGFLTKPFTVSDLSKALSKHVRSTKPAMNSKSKGQVKAKEKGFDGGNDDGESAEIINIAAIKNIQEVESHTGKPILPSLLEGFAEQMDEKLLEFSGLSIEEDPQAVYRAAHAIKSMSANIGAEKVRVIGERIERCAKQGQKVEIAVELYALDEAYKEFLAEFEQLIAM